jgi:hypothetical protein
MAVFQLAGLGRLRSQQSRVSKGYDNTGRNYKTEGKAKIISIDYRTPEVRIHLHKPRRVPESHNANEDAPF